MTKDELIEGVTWLEELASAQCGAGHPDEVDKNREEVAELAKALRDFVILGAPPEGLREKFAGDALSNMATPCSEADRLTYAKAAWGFADAMLKTRNT